PSPSLSPAHATAGRNMPISTARTIIGSPSPGVRVATLEDHLHRATTPYRGERYLDADEVQAACEALAAAHPRWIGLTEIGRSRGGRPITLVTLGDRQGRPDD